MFKSKKRPISPHLGIYQPQLTSMLSIFHRITGIILVMCITLPFFLQKLYINHIDLYEVYYIISMVNDIHSPILWTLILLAIASFFYHFFNGFRHLAWDMGSGLSIKAIYVSGYLVVFLTFLTVSSVMILLGIHILGIPF